MKFRNIETHLRLFQRSHIMIGVVFLIATSAAAYQFARPLWVPVYRQIKGKRTVDFVLEKLKPKWSVRVAEKFKKVGLGFPIENLVLIGIKDEQRLELWTSPARGKPIYVTEYRVLAASGKSGPKLKEGDLQVPEGIYKIEFLNPNSSYHLSMKINYPNAFDKEMARLDRRNRLGGDIFIHGKAVSIGCLAIGDEAIEELFYIVAKSKNVKVILSPTDFRKGKVEPKVNVAWSGKLYKIVKEELGKYPR